MELRANTDEENFTLSWTQEEFGARCQIKVRGNSLVFKDLDADRQQAVSTFQRVFVLFGPSLNIDQTVELGSMIPGFAAVSAAERRYTLSISFSRRFNGPLPDTAQIQLPDIAIGDQVITPPLLELKRHKDLLGHRDDYVPVLGRKVASSTLLSDFAACGLKWI